MTSTLHRRRRAHPADRDIERPVIGVDGQLDRECGLILPVAQVVQVVNMLASAGGALREIPLPNLGQAFLQAIKL